MVITYLGEGCFRIQSGNLSLVVDPLNDRVKPDVIVRTAVPFPPPAPAANEVLGAGEYEISDIVIRGAQIIKESNEKILKTAYRVTLEDIALGFLGELFSPPEAEVLQLIGEVDILFLPVGGKPYLGPEEAAKTVKQVAPRVVIPSFYKNPKDFLEEMGLKAVPQDKFTVKKKELVEAGEGIRVICLTH